jgi:hypothetical protein
MRKITICVITVSMLLGVLTACTQYLDTCERYVIAAAVCALPEKNESRRLYSSVVLPREFFETVDFGRGHFNLYGNTPSWYDEDNGRLSHHGSRHHDRACDRNPHHRYTRHSDYRDYEFSIPERHAPLMLPDVEYVK